MSYWIQFYVDPSRVTFAEMVAQTIQALLDSGCAYKSVRGYTTQDTSLPLERQRVSVEEQSLDIAEARHLAFRDAAKESHSYPHATLVFGAAFEFDDKARKMMARHGKRHEEQVNEVNLSFFPS